MLTSEEHSLNVAFFMLQNKEYERAIAILKQLQKRFPDNHKVISLLGISYYKINKNELSRRYLVRTIELGSESELIHLTLYLVYCNLVQYDEAMQLLFNYLQKHKAKYFKDTLQELVEGLQQGYMTNYQTEIEYFARLNRISIDC